MTKQQPSLPLVWTKHLKDPDSKQKFEQSLRASTTMAYRLLEILDEEERAIESQSCSVKDFDNPAWAFKQAFHQGEKARIRKLKELLEFINPNNT